MGVGPSKGRARRWHAMYLFFKQQRKFQKASKREKRVITANESVKTSAELDAIWKEGDRMKDPEPELPPLPEYEFQLEAMWAKTHEDAAETYLRFALRHKAMWVKFAQAIAANKRAYAEPRTRCSPPASAWPMPLRLSEKRSTGGRAFLA